MTPNELLMNGVVSGIQIVMILVLIIDIIISSMKWGQERMIWKAIEDGEMSYIRLVDAMCKVHGIRTEVDRKRGDKDVSLNTGHPNL